MERLIYILACLGAGACIGRKWDAKTLTPVKGIIFGLLLPATLFRALNSLTLEWSLIVLPILGLCCNLAQLISTSIYSRGFKPAKRRMLLLTLPSLAPGLTIYPILEAYGGDAAIAAAAFFDVGNKVWVLGGSQYLAYHLAKDSLTLEGEAQSDEDNSTLKILLSPANVAVFLGVAIALLKVVLPQEWLALLSVSSFGEVWHMLLAVNDRISQATSTCILAWIGASLNWSRVFPRRGDFCASPEKWGSDCYLARLPFYSLGSIQ